MARQVTAGHQALRASEHDSDDSGKLALAWVDDDGLHHITQSSDHDYIREAKERLANPDPETQELLGLPEDPTLEIIVK